MNADAIYGHCYEAAGEVLSDGPLTIEQLASLLAATHLTGGASAVQAIAGQPAGACRSFAAELNAIAETFLEEETT